MNDISTENFFSQINDFLDVNGPRPAGDAGRPQDDLADIISSMSRLFFSTYYINLEHDTYRAVTQLRRVGDILGDEVNCTAALQIYANHFVHPEDQAEYLRVMNTGSLRQELRWWKPRVAVEYRRQTDDPVTGARSWSWVRATAILARASRDDLPVTAVYVAQDISDGRKQPCPECKF